MWTDRQRYVTLRALAMLAFAALVVYLPETLGNYCETSGQSNILRIMFETILNWKLELMSEFPYIIAKAFNLKSAD